MKIFDIAEHLDSKEMIQGYLEQCFEGDDSAVFAAAVKDAIRAIKVHNLREVHVDAARIEPFLQPDKQPDIEILHYLMKALKLTFRTSHSSTS